MSIGAFQMDLMVIYLTENRCIQHRWVALTNPAKGLDKIMGYLKLSFSVVGEGDEQVPLEDEKLSEDGNLNPDQMNIMFPPQVKLKGHQIIINVFKGESIKKMDTIGSVDPYIQFKFLGAKHQTKVIKRNQNPIWMQQIYVSCHR